MTDLPDPIDAERLALADRLSGHIGPFNFLSKTERDLVIDLLRAPRREEPVACERKTNAEWLAKGLESQGHKNYCSMAAAELRRLSARRDEPVAWRYHIQRGPEGEEAYAWVFDDKNNLVCTAKTHHAMAIVNAFAHPAASQGEADRFEATPAGVIDWKAEAERANRLLAAEQYRNAVDQVNRSTDREINAPTSPAPSRPAARPMWEALELIDELLTLLVYKNEDHQRARDFVSRHRAAIAPASANEVKSSAPAPNGSLPSGESDPSVTLDRAGAEAMKQIKSVCEDNKPDFCNHKMALSFVMDIAERYLSGANEVKP